MYELIHWQNVKDIYIIYKDILDKNIVGKYTKLSTVSIRGDIFPSHIGVKLFFIIIYSGCIIFVYLSIIH